MIKLSPSILAADFSRLGECVKEVEEAGTDYLHLDVMDGHLVPNMSFGAPVVSGLRSHSKLVFDTHLMISEPHKYVESFAKAGADIITIHIECESDIDYTVKQIKGLGKKAGIALNPDTPIESVLPYRDELDMVLIMTVFAGFGGQSYIESVNEKITRARSLFGDGFDIEVDGGIYLDNLHMPVEAGANVIVAGTAVFGSGNPAEAVKKFKEYGR